MRVITKVVATRSLGGAANLPDTPRATVSVTVQPPELLLKVGLLQRPAQGLIPARHAPKPTKSFYYRGSCPILNAS